jgi:hypothetical protein
VRSAAAEAQATAAGLRAEGFVVDEARPIEAGLEDVFIELAEEAPQDPPRAGIPSSLSDHPPGRTEAP